MIAQTHTVPISGARFFSTRAFTNNHNPISGARFFQRVPLPITTTPTEKPQPW